MPYDHIPTWLLGHPRASFKCVCVCLCIIIIGFVEMKTFSVNPLKAFQVWWWHLSSKKYWTNKRVHYLYRTGMRSAHSRHTTKINCLLRYFHCGADDDTIRIGITVWIQFVDKLWLAPELKPWKVEHDAVFTIEEVFVWNSVQGKSDDTIRCLKR